MLIYFSVTNYKSFRDKAEFNMIAAPEHDDSKNQDHVYRGYSPHLLRLSAIYGNNGAGKSNLLDALATLKSIICGKYYKRANESNLYFKLDVECSNKPTVFETEFISNSKRYVYHLEVLKEKIVTEWLTNVDKDGYQTEIFKRLTVEAKESVIMPIFEDDEKEKIRLEIYAEEIGKRRFRTFLEYGASHGLSQLDDAYSWFDANLEVVKAGAHLVDKLSFFSNPDMRSLAVDMIHTLDISIQNIKVISVPFEDLFGGILPQSNIQEIRDRVDDNTRAVIMQKDGGEYQVFKDDNGIYMAGRIITVHKNGVEFELNEESTGTRMILELIPAFVASIIGRKIFVFDEIEVNKHPELTKELIMIYLLAGSSHEGQLIFTTHECNLLDLDLLRPDEIWFVEKDDEEASHMYSLSDYKPHYDKDIRKGYLAGRFTRIPFFADPKQLNWYGNTKFATWSYSRRKAAIYCTLSC